MNKAKVILSAVALLAVVGGALAFKATKITRNDDPFYTGTTTAVGGPLVCAKTTFLSYTTVPNAAQPTTLAISTVYNSLATCPTTALYPIAAE